MYKLCQSEQSALRQRELEQGLLHMMEKRTYEEITVSDLCREMEIPRKAFYRYFAGKDGALYSLIDHAIMDFDAVSVTERDWSDRHPREYMEQVFSHWIQNRELLAALARNNLSGVLIQRAADYTKQQNRLPMLLVNMDESLRDYGTVFAVCGLMTIIVQWHQNGFHPDAGEMARMALRLFKEPLYQTRE